MSNAQPTRFGGRGENFYSKEEPPKEQPGLTPTRTLNDPQPTTKESRRCACGAKVWLLDGATEVVCSCGEVQKK